MLTGSQKRKLKSIAHHLKPVVHIGKKGLTESLFSAIDKALKDHELIKIKFIDLKEKKEEISHTIYDKTGGELVSIIGNIAVFFRQNRDEEERKVVI